MTSRLTRGALLGACTGALAVAAHGLAGGGMPDTAPTVAIVALVAWAGSALADKGPWVTLGLLAGSQSALHLLLTQVAHPGSVADPVAMTVAHVAATLLTGWLFAHAGYALDALAAALRGLVRAVVAPLFGLVTTFVLVTSSRADALLAVVLRVVCGRRGPPVLS
ncbi:MULTISPECIES: hypothetical protein [Actinokineospora]|uniref:Uncharacterized protein n=1 Tax=Actinokineospora fastidiosa TaxID=1816 RepID=A0A918G459_9PSEU|nr:MULTISPECIES: hypothetical protein [Actinokineospora]UVS76373.1 hypothetical protein Actkin_00057 [Actinokineospora sp. UTMC 2448]GGS18693.1 hypothetical protein GCM10010171_09040 [Actinokineospora fastidiosa]